MVGSQPSVGQSQVFSIGNSKPESLLPPVSSNKFGRGAHGTDIASKRRQIAVLRSRHFEDQKENAYNSANSQSGAAEQEQAPLCRNGFVNQQFNKQSEPIVGLRAVGIGHNTMQDKLGLESLDKRASTMASQANRGAPQASATGSPS